MSKPITVWSIAGSDPSGGAGLQMDQRLLNSLGVHVGSVITALTAQSLVHFLKSMPVSAEHVASQMAALSKPPMPSPEAVKIGMVGSANNATVIGAMLGSHPQAFVVLDPVLAATSGGSLADEDTVQALIRLFPQVDLLTPNVPEAERLLGRSLTKAEDLPAAAAALRQLGAKQVLIKGGHLGGAFVQDYYLGSSGAVWLSGQRLTGSVRGTGCALASALAGFVALGHPVADALVLARARVAHGFRQAQEVCPGGSLLGDLHGPLQSEDMPWISADLKASQERPAFPSCGPKPLGFYPVVERTSWVKRCVDLGVTTIQLRVKDLRGEALREELRAAIAYCAPRGVRLFINDYWQLAIELGAYGVHLGQEDLDSSDVHQIAAAGLRLGISTHAYHEAARAHALRPSYIALGPIFATTSKQMPFSPQGMNRIAEWKRLFPYPLVAIGGLTKAHAAAAASSGADGVACISDVTKAADPDQQIRDWLAALR